MYTRTRVRLSTLLGPSAGDPNRLLSETTPQEPLRGARIAGGGVTSYRPVSRETLNCRWCPQHGHWPWKHVTTLGSSDLGVRAPWGPLWKGCGRVWDSGTLGLAVNVRWGRFQVDCTSAAAAPCTPGREGTPQLGNAAVWCQAGG